MHDFYLMYPLQECPQANILLQAYFVRLEHSSESQISSKVLIPVSLMYPLGRTLWQYLHFLNHKMMYFLSLCSWYSLHVNPRWYGMALQVLHCSVLHFGHWNLFSAWCLAINEETILPILTNKYHLESFLERLKAFPFRTGNAHDIFGILSNPKSCCSASFQA